jgi:microcystin-dependent protein
MAQLKHTEINGSLTVAGIIDFAPVGMVALWPTATHPAGWLRCAGQAVSQTTYNRLFQALGGNNSPFGVNNSNMTFNLPNFCDRFAWGVNINAPSGQPGRVMREKTSDPITTIAHTHNINHTHILSHNHAGMQHNHRLDHSHSIGSHQHYLNYHVHSFPSHYHTVSHVHYFATGAPTATRAYGWGLAKINEGNHIHTGNSGGATITDTNSTSGNSNPTTSVSGANSATAQTVTSSTSTATLTTDTANTPSGGADVNSDSSTTAYIAVHYIIKT